MQEKRLNKLYIKLNNESVIVLEQSKIRQFLDKASNKFHELLKKFNLIK